MVFQGPFVGRTSGYSASCSARLLAFAPLVVCVWRTAIGGDWCDDGSIGFPHQCKIKIDPTTQGVET